MLWFGCKFSALYEPADGQDGVRIVASLDYMGFSVIFLQLQEWGNERRLRDSI